MYIVQRGLCAVDGKLYASGTYFGDGCVVDARRDHNACAIALLDAHAIAREDLASLIASGDFGATRYYRAMMRRIKIPSLHNDASLSRGSRRTEPRDRAARRARALPPHVHARGQGRGRRARRRRPPAARARRGVGGCSRVSALFSWFENNLEQNESGGRARPRASPSLRPRDRARCQESRPAPRSRRRLVRVTVVPVSPVRISSQSTLCNGMCSGLGAALAPGLDRPRPREPACGASGRGEPRNHVVHCTL